MTFAVGERLGPYEIVAPLGAGGMGEVYRALDTRLDRIVAVKVLTGGFAADSESRQRFEQEARAIAALNDPHICTIHDVGRHGEADYLVLEYLEGETLADRLTRAPGLTIPEVLALAIQIGEALDRAHRAGIAHRDLKPGNVMLLRRGGPSSPPDVKLLDFGLAARTSGLRPKPIDASLGATVAASAVATRTSTTPVMSGFNGTLQYMAPEQLDGDAGDHRADIFAFGCVLYEMLAGRKAFDGTTAITVIAAIMGSEPPPIAALQSAHPPSPDASADRRSLGRGGPFLDHVLRRCLDKDRERRWQSMGDVTGELRWIATNPIPVPVAAPQGKRVAGSRIARVALPLGFVFATLAFAAGVRALRGREAAPEPSTVRFEVATTPTDDPSLAVSPDGRTIAFVANQNRVPVLWVRSLEAIENRPLPGTEGASFPFWSPDSRTVGFFAEDKLKRIDAAGGAPLVIADAPNARGGTWSAEGVILFVPGVTAPVVRVSARGGAAESVTQLNAGSGPAHRAPQFLPDGRRFLFTSLLGTAETNGIYLGSLDKTPPVRLVANEGSGRFAAPDQLLTIDQGRLQAYSFDPSSGRVASGEPVVVAQGLTGPAASSVFTTSDTGVLAYRPGTVQRRQLAWVDRRGAVLGVIGEPSSDSLASPELSADGRTVVVFRQPTGDNDIWAIELARSLPHRITDGEPADAHPLWDPDGQHVIFSSRRFGGGPIRQSVNSGSPEALFGTGERGVALAWTRDRQYILIRRDGTNGSADLVAVTTAGAPREVVVAQSQASETEGQFSPDGKWVALVSNDDGRSEAFLQPFPAGRPRTQVSTSGGTQVRWSADGREIYYVAPDGKMMAAAVALGGASADVKLPVALFQTRLATGINVLGNKPQYAVASDGRFLLNTAIESASAPIVVSVNWMRKLSK